MKVSTRGDYATRALLSLTLHGNDQPVAVKEIAEKTDLPQPYLEQILLSLKGAGLVKSKRGINGGYILARHPKEITLANIIGAVEGPISLGDFADPHTEGACNHEGYCVILAIWKKIGREMKEQLESWNLESIANLTNGIEAWPSEITET